MSARTHSPPKPAESAAPERTELRTEARSILRLAAPLAFAQGGLMLMGVVDTVIIGRTNPTEMAGVALGNATVALFLVFAIGLAMGVEPLAGQAFGAGELATARRWMNQASWTVLLVAVPLMALTALAPLAFTPMGIAPDLAERAEVYTWARVLGLPFMGLTVVLRSYLSNVGRTRPAVVAVVVANVANLGLDLVLVFGWLGLPALGAGGVGLATTICSVLMAAVYVAALALEPVLVEGRPSHLLEGPDPLRMRRVLGVGWPIGAQTTAEVGVFAAVSALIARFGEVPASAHQIALTMASFTFMVVVGVANATTARVGFHVGAGSGPRARLAGFLGIGLAAGFMGVCGLGFVAAPRLIALAFTTDPEVVERSVVFLRIAGVFAIADGVQVVSAGALRGLGDTRWAFYANLVAHWLVGLPVAIALGHPAGLGPTGYWWGLTVGLVVVALGLALRFARASKRPVQRLEGPPLTPVAVSRDGALEPR